MKRTTSYISWPEYIRLCRNLKEEGDDTYYGITLTTTFLALRIGDVLRLRWNDLLTPQGTVRDELHIREKKTGKERELIINHTLKREISYLYERFGRPKQGKRVFNVSIQAINQKFKRLFRKYSIDYQGNVSTHMFRKTFGHKVYEDGESKEESLTILNYILGHTSMETTKIYLGLRSDDTQKAFRSLSLDHEEGESNEVNNGMKKVV